jgi:hypothetical protein
VIAVPSWLHPEPREAERDRDLFAAQRLADLDLGRTLIRHLDDVVLVVLAQNRPLRRLDGNALVLARTPEARLGRSEMIASTSGRRHEWH